VVAGVKMVALLDIVITVVIIAIVVAVPVGVSVALNRGKRFKCPNCGKVFKAPLFDEKMLGVGWTFPYLGNVECPHCHTTRSRRAYGKVKKSEVT
jgi:hypothetical protein